MKKIKSFEDINFIVSQRIDVKDADGKPISYLKFMYMKLVDIIHILDQKSWTYDTEI